jgi:hypothetical protein
VTPDVGDGVTSGRPHRRRSSLHVRNNFNTELCRHSTKSEVWLVSWAYPPPRTTHAKIKPQRRLYSDLLKSTVAAACLEIKIEYGTRSRGLIWTRSKKARPPHLRAQMDYCRSQPREGLWARAMAARHSCSREHAAHRLSLPPPLTSALAALTPPPLDPRHARHVAQSAISHASCRRH